MNSSDLDPQLAEEQLLAALHDSIISIRRSAGTCTADALTERLTQQLRAGLLSTALPGGDSTAAALDVEALVNRSYPVEITIGARPARAVFTPGLSDSGLAHGEHMDIRATVTVKHRVDHTLTYGLTSTDEGVTWILALAEAEREWLVSAREIKELAAPHITELVHDPRHRGGLAPVVDAARHVAATRALFVLDRAREQLAWASSRDLVARAAFDRYGCSESDMWRLRDHLAQLTTQGRVLVGW